MLYLPLLFYSPKMMFTPLESEIQFDYFYPVLHSIKFLLSPLYARSKLLNLWPSKCSMAIFKLETLFLRPIPEKILKVREENIALKN